MRRAERLDDELLLEAYMQGFFGYGSLSGAYWLVGIEERGGDTLEDVDARLRAWDSRGRLELEDVFEFSEKAGQGRWFGPKARLQRTWANFIRIVLGAEGLDAGREKVRQYQSRHFGRAGGETCLVNLMPLPSRSCNEWRHANISTLPHLERESPSLHGVLCGATREANPKANCRVSPQSCYIWKHGQRLQVIAASHN